MHRYDSQDAEGRERVVITGLGLVTPCGIGHETVWARLLDGQSGIAPITRFDTTGFKTTFAGECREFNATDYFDDKFIRHNDRFVLFATAAAEMAMEHAKLVIDPARAHRVGVIVGSGMAGLETIEQTHTLLSQRGPTRVSPFFVPAILANLAPGQISIRIGAKGPNWSPVSACATGSHAIGEAMQMVRRGTCDVVVCGGSEATVSPLAIAGFNAMKALSTRNDDPTRASRPWDKSRQGFVLSEGAALLVIESLAHAVERGASIIAELVGYSATGDAHHITQPGGDGAASCMRNALADAGIAPESVGYVHAHATSTPVGDLQEIAAIKNVFGNHAHALAVSSTKSMHGHLLGAAGSISTSLTAKMLQTGILLPTTNLDEPDEGCDLDFIRHTPRHKRVDFACANAFGFGGTNATLVLKAFH